MPVFLGLDCGGSSCRALALDEEGRVLHQGQSGAGNILSTPHAILRKNLCAATRDCPEPDAVSGCFAGLLTDQERGLALTMLREIAPMAKLRAEPDYCAAFMAAPEGTHVCVIAGTGSIICSRSGDGWVKSGGRGYLLGNPGSAFRYGQAAMGRYLDDPASSGEALQKGINEVFGSLQESDVVAKLYRSPSPAALLAKLLPAFAKDAKAGEEYAVQTLGDQTRKLATQTADHVKRYLDGVSEPNIATAGGVWDAAGIFRESFFGALQSELPDKNPILVKLVGPPVYGAAMLAKEMIG